MLDTMRIPRAARYVDGLPRGLESYPECQTRHDAVEGQCELLREAVGGLTLPPILHEYIHYWKSDWVPLVVAHTGLMMMRDLIFESDDKMLEWSHASMKEVLNKPVYRVIMRVLSTTLVVMGVTNRWHTFHRGTTLTSSEVTASDSRVHAKLTLNYPAHSFTELSLRHLSKLFLSSIEVANARAPEAVVLDAGETQASFRIAWAK